MTKQKPSFWVVNLSNRNVTLADLAVNIPAFRTVNLLDEKHYHYTLEQLEKSEKSGSIYNKRDKIKKCFSAPEMVQPDRPTIAETHIPSRERSVLVIKEQHFEELDFSQDQKKQEEEFAKDNAESAQMDEIKDFAPSK